MWIQLRNKKTNRTSTQDTITVKEIAEDRNKWKLKVQRVSQSHDA